MKNRSEKLNVLLATGDDYLRESLLEILNEKDFYVNVVSNCKEVLESLIDSDFDFFIFDPEIKACLGPDALQIAKELKPDLPIIVVSDESAFETGVKIARLGVYFRLGKPIDEKVTKELIENLEEKIKKE